MSRQLNRRVLLKSFQRRQSSPLSLSLSLQKKCFSCCAQCLERVLVQNLHNDLTPSLSEILSSVPRWRLIQAALPYVLHATASLLHNR